MEQLGDDFDYDKAKKAVVKLGEWAQVLKKEFKRQFIEQNLAELA